MKQSVQAEEYGQYYDSDDDNDSESASEISVDPEEQKQEEKIQLHKQASIEKMESEVNEILVTNKAEDEV